MGKSDFGNELQLFADHFGRGGEVHLFHAPGRVNIIGEHLDYNGGYVFPAAISLGIYALVRKRDDDIIRMRSVDFPGEILFSLSGDLFFDREVMWGNYPRGVMAALKKKGIPLSGADLLFFSTLPKGSGLSSSAAMEVLTAFLMQDGKGFTESKRRETALICQEVENNFIGVQCGIMDQFAVAMGRENHAILLRSHDLHYRYVSFRLKDYFLMIMNSNKPRALADSKYNERRTECQHALEMIQRKRSLVSLAEGEISDLDYVSEDVLKKRARHVITENRRTLEAVTVLENNDFALFGEMMTASHRSLQNDYDVTGPELDTLVDVSLEVDGCLGARMTGAGFGGCAIALVNKKAADDFEGHVGEVYRACTGLNAEFFRAHITDGVREIGI